MFKFLKQASINSGDVKLSPPPSEDWLREILHSSDPYLYVLPPPIPAISIFDDLRFDRSDIDNLSPGMYRYVNDTLCSVGFKRMSGRCFGHETYAIKCIIPQARVQGASPFHATHYLKKSESDFYILTPTQCAALIIEEYKLEQAVTHLVELIHHHPINLFKIKDHLESKDRHQQFLQAIPHLKYTQRIAVSSPPLSLLKTLK